MLVQTSCAVLSGSLKRSSTAGNVAGTFSLFWRYNTCAIQPVMSAQAVFCQCVQPFTIRIDDQRCKILHVSGFVVCTQADFIKYVAMLFISGICTREPENCS
jgi:hypothetical protein